MNATEHRRQMSKGQMNEANGTIAARYRDPVEEYNALPTAITGVANFYTYGDGTIASASFEKLLSTELASTAVTA